MDSNYGDVGQSWRMSSQAPLDSKVLVNKLSDLTDLGTGAAKPFLYYRGMKIYCHETKKTYEWTDNLNDQQNKVLSQNYVYPAGSEYDGISYVGLEFNFVEVLTIYKQEELSSISSVGNGVPIFNGFNAQNNSNEISSLKSNTLSVTKIIQDGPDKGSLLVDYKKTINKLLPGETNPLGVSLVDETTSNFEVWSLESETLSINRNNNRKTISIETPNTVDDSIKQFYVNETYAGANPTGSILKPYPKLTQALNAAIGTGTRIQPQFLNSSILLQTNVIVNQSDLNSVPELAGRISVNSITIKSDSETIRLIDYQGNLDYPIDTQELCNTARNGNSDLPYPISLVLKNINLFTTKVKGNIRHWSYDGHGVFNATKFTANMILDTVKVTNFYSPESYVNMKNSDGSNTLLYSSLVMCQSTIANTTPHVYFYGKGNIAEGQLQIKDLLIEGSSQTHLKCFNTTVNLGEITVAQYPYMVSVEDQNKTDGIYDPKSNLFAIHNDGSWIRIQKYSYITQIASTDIGYQGGFDSLFRLEKKIYNSVNNVLIIMDGLILISYSNSLISIDETFSVVNMQNCNFNEAITKIGAFVKTGNSTLKYININGSTINNVKPYSSSIMPFNIVPTAINAYVNGFNFSTSQDFANDIDARAAGLINGNEYFNTTTQTPKRLQ